MTSRRAMLTAVGGIALPAIGDPFMGGFLAGIIDTTSNAGLRYALIVGPKSLESSGLQYKTSGTLGPEAARTRWDGLAATSAMADFNYPAANYCYGLAYPGDGASRWYLPAMDELELIYRNLKATTEGNRTGTEYSTFPGAQPIGSNPSSAPTGSAYSSSAPAQTGAAAFRDGGSEALGATGTNSSYWSSTENPSSDAWYQNQSGSFAGSQSVNSKSSNLRVRPVRRLILPAA